MTEFEIAEVARELEDDLVREAFLQRACANDVAKFASVKGVRFRSSGRKATQKPYRRWPNWMLNVW